MRPAKVIVVQYCENAYGTWFGQGPFGGDVFSLEISPQKPERIYAVPAWGFFRSDDEGQTWLDLSGEIEDRRIQAIAVAPDDADTVYVTTSTELLKSEDGGHSWVHLKPDATLAIAGQLNIDINPHDSSDITVAAPNQGGLYRSSDGGTSWTRLDEDVFNGIGTFAYWPDNRDLLVVVGQRPGFSTQIYRSTNGGLDWDLAVLDVRNIPSSRLKFLSHSDGRLLLSATSAGFGIGSTMFESTDDGETWLELASDCPLLDGAAFFARTFETDWGDSNVWYLGGRHGVLRFSSGQSCSIVSHGMTTAGQPDMEAHVHSLKMKPGDSNVLYAGTSHAGVFRSDDGGNSWEQRNHGLSRAIIRALASHPADGNILYAGYGDAPGPADTLWISMDGGETWSADVEDLGLTGVRDIAIDPNTSANFDETHMYAVGWGFQYSGLSGGLHSGSAGVFKSIDGGRSWSESGGGIHLRDFDNETVWTSRNYPVMQSIALVPADDGGPSQTLYVAGNGVTVFDSSTGGCTQEAHRIYKSIDAGNNWVPADEGLPLACDRSVQIIPMVIDPVDPQTLYVGTFLTLPGSVFTLPMPTPVDENGVFKSTDGGTSWSLSSFGLPIFDEDNPDSSHWDVSALAVAPSESNVLYAAVRRSFHLGANFVSLPQPSMVYTTTDGGASWSPANGGMPEDVDIRGLAVDPDDAGTVYAANARASVGAAVFRSTDGGANWAPYSDGLSGTARVLTIDKRGSSALLHAGTDTGVFSIRERD